MLGRAFSRRSDWLRRVGSRQHFSAVYRFPLAQDSWNGHAVRDRGIIVRDPMGTPDYSLFIHCPLLDANGVQRALSPCDISLFPELLARDIIGPSTLSSPLLASRFPLFRLRPSGCTVGRCSHRDRCRVPQHRPCLDDIFSAQGAKTMNRILAATTVFTLTGGWNNAPQGVADIPRVS